MDTDEIIISCLQMGLSLTDFMLLEVGTIFDIMHTFINMNAENEKNGAGNNKKEKIREATKKDINAFFNR